MERAHRHAVVRRRRRTAVVVLVCSVAAACSRAPLPDTELSAGAGAGGDGFEVAGPSATTATGPQAGAPGLGAAGGSDGLAPAPSVSIDPATGQPVATAPGQAPAPDAPGTPQAPAAGGTPGAVAPAPVPGTASPVAGPYQGADDVRGIDADSITFCAHAALTYGAAFDTSAEDLNVYWTAVNEAGGVHGRKVEVFYENDNYQPETAVQAATTCKDDYDPFMLLGGIGFDQIPAVRTWAENNRMLYFHHTATVQGSEGKVFSYTGLPTTEKMGEMFAQLAATRFAGKSVGIVKRGSPNWEPGVEGFKRVAEQRGVEIAIEREVQVNKGAYLQDIIDLQNAGADVVWLWLNALESTEFIQQAAAQRFRPQFMVFPFNLTTQTLGDAALDPPLAGVAMYNAYSEGDRSGEFARYADDLAQFEAQYAKHRPNVDLGGVGGDLLFLNWSAQKVMHRLLLDCGADCTRNSFIQTTQRYRGVPTSSACVLDFTRPESAGGHRGGFAVSVMEAYRAPDGKVNFRNTSTCVEGL
jgi:hypothetical protein